MRRKKVRFSNGRGRFSDPDIFSQKTLDGYSFETNTCWKSGLYLSITAAVAEEMLHKVPWHLRSVSLYPSTPHADSVARVGKGTEHRIAFLYKHNDQGLREDDIIAHNSQKPAL